MGGNPGCVYQGESPAVSTYIRRLGLCVTLAVSEADLKYAIAEAVAKSGQMEETRVMPWVQEQIRRMMKKYEARLKSCRTPDQFKRRFPNSGHDILRPELENLVDLPQSAGLRKFAGDGWLAILGQRLREMGFLSPESSPPIQPRSEKTEVVDRAFRFFVEYLVHPDGLAHIQLVREASKTRELVVIQAFFALCVHLGIREREDGEEVLKSVLGKGSQLVRESPGHRTEEQQKKMMLSLFSDFASQANLTWNRVKDCITSPALQKDSEKQDSEKEVRKAACKMDPLLKQLMRHYLEERGSEFREQEPFTKLLDKNFSA